VAITSVVAISISHQLIGTQPSVYIPALEVPDFATFQPVSLAQFLLSGGIMGLLSVSLPTFAIAGMAAMIAGTTGAFFTRIIMLAEMTQDHRVILSLIITTAVAYAIRRTLMEESIYTMKLIARRHRCPGGSAALNGWGKPHGPPHGAPRDRG